MHAAQIKRHSQQRVAPHTLHLTSSRDWNPGEKNLTAGGKPVNQEKTFLQQEKKAVAKHAYIALARIKMINEAQ